MNFTNIYQQLLIKLRTPTVDVDFEGDLNLGDTTWCWWDASQVKVAQHVVVLGHGTLAFVHLQSHNLVYTSQ